MIVHHFYIHCEQEYVYPVLFYCEVGAQESSETTSNPTEMISSSLFTPWNNIHFCVTSEI